MKLLENTCSGHGLACSDAGAKLLAGGKRHGAIVEATVLENVPSDCHVACDEVFGPVMILDRYATFKDAVAK